jgi:hypothetical protein
MADPPHSGSDARREARRLAALSRQLVNAAKAHIETAEQRLDRARNVLQVSVLWRALRHRRRALHRGRLGVGADAVAGGAAGGRGASERLRDRRDRWLGSDRWPRVVRVDDAD